MCMYIHSVHMCLQVYVHVCRYGHVCAGVLMSMCMGVYECLVLMRVARELYFCEGGNVPAPSWTMSTWTVWYKTK